MSSSFDNKVYTIVQNIDEIKKEMYPVGIRVFFKGSCTLPGIWKLVGIHGRYQFEDDNYKHFMTFYGTTLEDQVYIKSFNYQNSTNDRNYGTNTLSWSNFFRSGNYTIDFVKTTAQCDSFSTGGFGVWVSGVGEAEWGINKGTESQEYVEWFTYAPNKGMYNGYTATFVITIKDLSLFGVDSCYNEYEKIEI